MSKKKIKVLGTKYEIRIHKVSEDEILKKNHWDGYCDEDQKLIVTADMNETEFYDFSSQEAKEKCQKCILRHEIVHAFLNESGLSYSANKTSCAWSKNEEMVDWFAIQSPKIFKVYRKLGIL